jgi:hypothetical protein
MWIFWPLKAFMTTIQNALPNVLNSQWEYFIANHGYNGCPQ